MNTRVNFKYKLTKLVSSIWLTSPQMKAIDNCFHKQIGE